MKPRNWAAGEPNQVGEPNRVGEPKITASAHRMSSPLAAGEVLGCVVVAGPGGIVCEGSGVVGFGDVAYADFRPGPFAGVGDVLGHGCAVSSSRVTDDGQFGHVVSPLWWVVGVSLVVGRRLVAPCGGKHPAGADGDGDSSVCSAGEASTGAVLSLLYRIQGRFFLVRGGVQAPRMLCEPVRLDRWSGSE